MRTLFTIALIAGVLQASIASAQTRFGSGSTGSAGTTGSSTRSSSGQSMSRTGTTANSTQSRGNSGIAGQTPTLGATSNLNAGDGSLGAQIGSRGFIGGINNSGGFIGGNQSATSQGRRMNSQMFSQLQNLGNGQFSGNTSQTPQQLMRPQVRLGFNSPIVAPEAMQLSVQNQFTALPALGERGRGVVATSQESGEIILRGSVASEEDRRLMEILTRMEPGVRTVRNELEISK
ncbi:BON domain-containing protein [Planctomicrobium sp. SH668]|uniref:BON domain-containing protein n=1 Tax=Planctomicrobium sp. SH668 TaxID=3448126 RepID=UPI003F5C627E